MVLLCCLMPSFAFPCYVWSDFETSSASLQDIRDVCTGRSESTELNGPLVEATRRRSDATGSRMRIVNGQLPLLAKSDWSSALQERLFGNGLACTPLRLFIGLGCLGEIWFWVVKWLLLRFVPPKAFFKSGPRVKVRKVPAPRWIELQKRKGPWRQACRSCRWFINNADAIEARRVVKQRVCGVKGACGLGSCFRGSHVKSMSDKDAKRIRACVRYLWARWPTGCPESVQSREKGHIDFAC